MDKEVWFELIKIKNEMWHERRKQLLREAHIVRCLNDQIKELMKAVPNFDKETSERLMKENGELYKEGSALNDKAYESILVDTQKAYDDLCENDAQGECGHSEICGACAGYYDDNGSPPCGACGGFLMFIKADQILFNKCILFEKKYGFIVSQFSHLVQNDIAVNDKYLRDFLIASRKAKEEKVSGLESEFKELMKELITHAQKDEELISLDGCERVALKTTSREKEILESFNQKLLGDMVEMPPEFNKAFIGNLKDILG
jgi:hypothetical protein